MNRIIKKIINIDNRLIIFVCFIAIIIISPYILDNILKRYESNLKEGLNNNVCPSMEWCLRNPACLHESSVRIREMRLEAIKERDKRIARKMAKYNPFEQQEAQ